VFKPHSNKCTRGSEREYSYWSSGSRGTGCWSATKSSSAWGIRKRKDAMDAQLTRWGGCSGWMDGDGELQVSPSSQGVVTKVRVSSHRAWRWKHETTEGETDVRRSELMVPACNELRMGLNMHRTFPLASHQGTREKITERLQRGSFVGGPDRPPLWEGTPSPEP
jgi:hypothetical protein